jgi:hypothetical protein
MQNFIVFIAKLTILKIHNTIFTLLNELIENFKNNNFQAINYCLVIMYSSHIKKNKTI